MQKLYFYLKLGSWLAFVAFVSVLIGCSASKSVVESENQSEMREEIRLGRTIWSEETGRYHRWSFFPVKDSSSVTGFRLFDSCSETIREIQSFIDPEVLDVIEDESLGVSEYSGSIEHWSEEDFFRFRREVFRSLDQLYPESGGFYDSFREWLLTFWNFTGFDRRTSTESLCASRYPVNRSASQLIDSIVIEIAINPDSQNLEEKYRNR